MKSKTPGEVIALLEREIREWEYDYPGASKTHQAINAIACLQRAIAIVRLWDAGITPADVRKAERKRRAK